MTLVLSIGLALSLNAAHGSAPLGSLDRDRPFSESEPIRTNPNQSERKRVIVIDPGHPSEVGRGTKGKFISEIDVAWQVGSGLKRKLEAAGYRVVMTKATSQTYVANRDRAKVANQSKADLMVRLHCDHAVGDSGFATFYADRQGSEGGRTGPPKTVIERVKKMATAFHRAAMSKLAGKLRDRGLRTDRMTNVGGKYGALIGSIHCDSPSILVEMSVLSSRSDENFIRSAQGQSKMVDALQAGVEAALRTTD